MLTKKDYIAIAAILHTSTDAEETAHALANYFEHDNPAFDKERFLNACGL